MLGWFTFVLWLMPGSSHVPRHCNFLKLITLSPRQLVNLVHVTATRTSAPQFLIRPKPTGVYFIDDKMLGTSSWQLTIVWRFKSLISHSPWYRVPARAKSVIAFLPALRPPTSPLLHTQIFIYPFRLLHVMSFTHCFRLPFKLFLIFFAVIFFLSSLFSLSAFLVCCLLSNLQIAQSVSDWATV